jgi:hypothetical protein
VKRLAWIIALAALAGCGDVEAPQAPGTLRSEKPEDRANTQVVDLAGTWQVASIDGEPVPAPNGLALRGDGDSLSWEPGCAGLVRRYRISGAAIAFTPLHAPPPPGSPTRPVCAIGLPARLGDVFQVLAAATSVARTPEGHVTVAGAGRSLTLIQG